MSETPAVPTPIETETQKVEAVVDAFAPVVEAVIPEGAEVGAALTAGEAVANSVEASEATHASVLATTAAAATTLVTASAPVIATLPEADQGIATQKLNLLQEILADLKGIFGL